MAELIVAKNGQMLWKRKRGSTIHFFGCLAQQKNIVLTVENIKEISEQGWAKNHKFPSFGGVAGEA